MTNRILCVDDNERNLRILHELLGDDYQLTCAASGEEAVEQLSGGLPDLILLDVMMPGISGYELCRQLKSDPATSGIPVVLVTARAREDERRAGFDAGADAYLIKPFDPDVLLDLVEGYLPVVEG